jgi:hypothetical protein
VFAAVSVCSQGWLAQQASNLGRVRVQEVLGLLEVHQRLLVGLHHVQAVPIVRGRRPAGRTGCGGADGGEGVSQWVP